MANVFDQALNDMAIREMVTREANAPPESFWDALKAGATAHHRGRARFWATFPHDHHQVADPMDWPTVPVRLGDAIIKGHVEVGPWRVPVFKKPGE